MWRPMASLYGKLRTHTLPQVSPACLQDGACSLPPHSAVQTHRVWQSYARVGTRLGLSAPFASKPSHAPLPCAGRQRALQGIHSLPQRRLCPVA